MEQPTPKELQILEQFVGDHCETFMPGIGPQIWAAMQEKGWIEECENEGGYRITKLGEQIRQAN